MTGFEFFNASGNKIIGSDFANLCFYGSGRVQCPAGGISIPMAPGGVINFYRSQYPLIEMGGRLYMASPGQWNGDWWYGGGRIAGWIEYWSFGPSNVEGANRGMEFLSPHRKVMFSTARPFLRVIGKVEVSTDSYQFAGDTRVYRPFSAATGFDGNKAFALGNARVYWTSAQLASGNSFFTDTTRHIRGMHLDARGNFYSSPIQTAQQRFGGRAGNFNYSPNGNVPMTMLVADISGL